MNTATGEPMYGLQVYARGQWKHLAEDGVPCIYSTEAERDAKRAQYRRLREDDVSVTPMRTPAVLELSDC